MLLALLTAAQILAAMPLTARGEPFPLYENYDPLNGYNTPGVVTLDMVIDANGGVARCDVVVPSGDPRIDKLACDRQHGARYKPARDAAGQPVAALVHHRFAVRTLFDFTVSRNVDFAVPISRMPSSATTPTVAAYVVTDAAGAVSDCLVHTSSGNRTLDQLACTALRGADLPRIRDARGETLRALREVSVGFTVDAAAAGRQ